MKRGNSQDYIGRYAPSPTGRLHLGNLRTALLAWLHAQLNNGKFLLRMDDLDTPRVVKGSDMQILSDLEWLGLSWQEGVYYQSQNLEKYESEFERFKESNLVYPCYCSRKDIQQAASAPHGKTPVYPGSCSQLTFQEVTEKQQKKRPAWRVRVNQFKRTTVSFIDGVFGEQSQNLLIECGDFVLKRADDFFAYQFAVVLDDIQQKVTDVVRGYDLMDSSARQIALFDTFDSTAPNYWHMPLLNDEQGKRMAKRDGSCSIEAWKENAVPDQLDTSSESLVGFLAHSVGLIPEMEKITTQELLTIVSSNNSLINSLKEAAS